MHDLAIVAIVRNEARYIREWVAFHALVGVEAFYLYDDGSEDDTIEEAYRGAENRVRVEPFAWSDKFRGPEGCPFRDSHQINAFNRWLAEHGGGTRWAAFIDVDEFLYNAVFDDLMEGLVGLERCGCRGLFVNWLIFGSSGHRLRPRGALTIEAYTRRAEVGQPEPTGRHGKIVADPAMIQTWGRWGSHLPELRPGCAIRTEAGERVTAATSRQASVKLWRINHYYHRSTEEAGERIAAVDNNAVSGFFKNEGRMLKHERNEVGDVEILRFLPKLRERLG